MQHYLIGKYTGKTWVKILWCEKIVDLFSELSSWSGIHISIAFFLPRQFIRLFSVAPSHIYDIITFSVAFHFHTQFQYHLQKLYSDSIFVVSHAFNLYFQWRPLPLQMRTGWRKRGIMGRRRYGRRLSASFLVSSWSSFSSLFTSPSGTKP